MLETSENHLRPNLDYMVDDLRQRYAQTVVTSWTAFLHVIFHFGLEETPVPWYFSRYWSAKYRVMRSHLTLDVCLVSVAFAHPV